MLVKNGTRDHISIDLYLPTPIALPVAGPMVSEEVLRLIESKHINFHPLSKLKAVLNKEIIESHVIRNSGLIKQGHNWINVDRFTLKTDYDNVFAIGDVTEIKLDKGIVIPKAGIFAEGQAKVVSQNIIHEITTNKLHNPKFDGKGFCFMEIGSKNWLS